MAKGKKCKIPIEKRKTKQQRSLACNRRRKTVFSKAADLCLHAGANIAVFVTSPAESSDVVYSFSGYSSALEIADSYLNDKPPPKTNNLQPKLGFWWEDPDLYRNCEDITELNMIEDRIEKMKDYVKACIENKLKLESVDQNPNSSCSGSSSSFVADLDQNPNSTSSSVSLQIASSDQNSYSSLEKNCSLTTSDQNPNSSCFMSSSLLDQNPNSSSVSTQIASFDQNPSFSVEEILASSDQPFSFQNNSMSLTQETQTEPLVDVDDESFWDNLLNEHVFGLNNDFCPDPQANSNNEDYMIDIGEFFNEGEIEF